MATLTLDEEIAELKNNIRDDRTSLETAKVNENENREYILALHRRRETLNFYLQQQRGERERERQQRKLREQQERVQQQRQAPRFVERQAPRFVGKTRGTSFFPSFFDLFLY